MSKTHKDLEFAVESAAGKEIIFKKFDEAAGFAIAMAASHGRTVHLDVLAWSRSAARAWAGEEGVETYNEDPEASVFDRIEIRADSKGRVA